MSNPVQSRDPALFFGGIPNPVNSWRVQALQTTDFYVTGQRAPGRCFFQRYDARSKGKRGARARMRESKAGQWLQPGQADTMRVVFFSIT
jgi:hypothetical protein